ncbi:MAG: hypothetical protein HN353_00630 [Bdellovibrionales bacterium]|nr:hypothetical protein [Bdellovibrionales bacterium]MBT3525636.1 hypothetical protein [Bdellovibrionales bacterium]
MIISSSYFSKSKLHKSIMFGLALLLAAIITTSIHAKSAEKLYSMEDLRILAVQNSTREYLESAREILPSKRAKEWNKLTQQMGRAYIVDQIKKERFTRANHHFIESLTNWPILRRDEFFQIRREQFNLSYFQNCSAKVECIKEVAAFWNNSTDTLHLGQYIELGIKLAQHFKSAISPQLRWKMLSPATKSELSNFYCQRDVVKQVVLNRIEIIFNQQNEKGKLPLGDRVATIANRSCLKQIALFLKRELPTLSAHHKDLTYRLLASNSLLNPSDRDLLLVTYLLENPLTGETFNEAWNVIEELGLNFKRRQRLLNRIKLIDPLPGKVFASPNLKKRKVITNLVYQNFPEYLDLYSKQCLSYLEGTVAFTNGNPTVECRDLVRTSKNTRWLSQRVLKKLQKIIK